MSTRVPIESSGAALRPSAFPLFDLLAHPRGRRSLPFDVGARPPAELLHLLGNLLYLIDGTAAACVRQVGENGEQVVAVRQPRHDTECSRKSLESSTVHA